MDVEKLIEQKERLGMSCAELSMRSRVPLSTVYKIFQGRTAKPRGETLWMLAEALGFYAEDEEPFVYRDEDYYTFDENGCVLHEDSPYGSYNSGTGAKKDYHKKQGEYTIEDYYNWPEDRRIELINGEIYYLDEIVDGKIAGPHSSHQIAVGDLAYALRQYIMENNGDCLALTSPLDVRLNEEKDDIVQPDVIVICDRSKFQEQGIVGAPDFVAEVLSKSTRQKDERVKLIKYKEAGVREYWVIDPMSKDVTAYAFGETNSVNFYSFSDDMPVAIYDGKCKINLSKTAQLLDSLYPPKKAK